MHSSELEYTWICTDSLNQENCYLSQKKGGLDNTIFVDLYLTLPAPSAKKIGVKEREFNCFPFYSH